MPYPRLLRVRQNFPRPRVDNIPQAVRDTLTSLNLKGRIKPGQTVALTAGSRGIANIPVILKSVVQHLRDLGALPFLVGTPAIVHSTSWRYENDGTVVLTYVAFGERITPKAETWGDVRTVAKAQLPDLGVTDPDHPRPKSIEHADVLSHGLRHLALLARRRGGNQAFIERLSERSRKFFSSIEPELAGEIGGSNMLVPSDSEAR